MSDIENLLDEEGENQAVRDFLMLYQGDPSCNVGAMRQHMRRAGWDRCWPAWAGNVQDRTHLTKSGAQSWLRHLFSLEGKQ